MSRKPARYTRHVRERMALRRISIGMVTEAIFSPERTGTGYLKRSLAWRTFPAGTVKVVYSEKPDAIVVITAMWA